MWLRDSVAQLRPHLVPAQNGPELAEPDRRPHPPPVYVHQHRSIRKRIQRKGPDGNCWEKDKDRYGTVDLGEKV